MGLFTILRRGLWKQKGTVIGIAVLLFASYFAACMALMVHINADRYVQDEMSRLGYGDITAWISEMDNLDRLAEEIRGVSLVGSVDIQPLIYSGYQINGMRSDNEGQLLFYDEESYPYQFLNDTLDGYQIVDRIESGEIYISPAMQSTYDVQVGDEIRFSLSRGMEAAVFTVGGYFEDPFMGSSMIDMKSFLINREDFETVLGTIQDISDLNILARQGAMLHISGANNNGISVMDLNGEINRRTALPAYTEFVYTRTSMEGFMLILQNIFTGFLSAFAILLLIVAMIVMGHSISAAIETDSKDMAVLKTLGYTGRNLRFVQVMLYMTGIVAGMAVATLCAALEAGLVARMTVTSTGFLMPSDLPYGVCLLVAVGIIGLFIIFVYVRTSRIMKIAPVQTINGTGRKQFSVIKVNTFSEGKMLVLKLAIRQLTTGTARYIGVCLVAVFLTFFLSVIGRMGTWLGANGEGLMDAFSAADHDIGFQPVHEMDMDEVEEIISSYAQIQGRYRIAMQEVIVNGADYTANVLDEPEEFHILSGSICYGDDEILITDFVAENLGIGIGSNVIVSNGQRDEEYRVSGIYQCANETGGNIGMSEEGYARIGSTDGYIWCYHYILSDSSRNEQIMNALNEDYRLDADIHTNSWSGLDGIVDTMHLLIMVMYVIVALCIAVTIALTSSRFLHAEQKDMAILKSIGLITRELRVSFAARFGMAVLAGAIIGMGLSSLLSDSIITALLRSFGISVFRSSFDFAGGVLPVLVVTVLFMLFAYAASRRLKQLGMVNLMNE